MMFSQDRSFLHTIESDESSTILTVSELTNSIKHLLEGKFPSISLQGEISNFKPHSTGHYYFNLKDDKAKVPAVMFRGQNASLLRLPKEGDKVIVKAALSVYPPQGKYQIVVRELQYLGIGELLLKLEELKKKLLERGWFSKERKKPLPKFPKTIGVITSPTGSVIKDILHVLSRRHSKFHVILSPVRVQGREAVFEIAEAIRQFNEFKNVDVIILARGGGSLEDLWAFNEEIVAEALFKSQIPIISAIGHETDFTLADFVADVRAPTPSAAAEIVMQEKAHHLQYLAKMSQGFQHTLCHLFKNTKERLNRFQKHPFFSSPYALLGVPMQRLDEIRSALDQQMVRQIETKRLLLVAKQKQKTALSPMNQLNGMKERLVVSDKRLQQLMIFSLQRRRDMLKKVVSNLAALDPKNVLQRGYSILFDLKKQSVILSAEGLSHGDEVKAHMAKGQLTLIVKK